VDSEPRQYSYGNVSRSYQKLAVHLRIYRLHIISTDRKDTSLSCGIERARARGARGGRQAEKGRERERKGGRDTEREEGEERPTMRSIVWWSVG
jgi:hypothetical protein